MANELLIILNFTSLYNLKCLLVRVTAYCKVLLTAAWREIVRPRDLSESLEPEERRETAC